MSETDFQSVDPSANEPLADTSLRSRQLGERVRSLRLPDKNEGRGMTRYLPWILCLVFAGAAYYFFQTDQQKTPGNSSAPNETTSGKSDSNPVATPINTTPNAPTGNVALVSKGNIIPARQILVSPQVSGIILSLKISEGDRIAKNAIIAELEAVDFEADRDRAEASLSRAKSILRRNEATLQRAQAREKEAERGFREQEIEQAHAELDEAKSQLTQAAAEFQRTERLRERSAVSPHEFEVAKSKFEGAQSRVKRLGFAHDLMRLGERDERKEMARLEVKQAEADLAEATSGVTQAEAELAKATWRRENCTIRAPISGTILKKNAEEGNLVNPVAQQGSFSLCEMADLSDLEVELKIQERDIARVFKGQKCKIIADAYRDREYQGVVSRLMPIADRAKAAIPVRVKVIVPPEEEGVYLKPEMGAEVTFLNDLTGEKSTVVNTRSTAGDSSISVP